MTIEVRAFEAVAMCPACAEVAVHPFREPRRRPVFDGDEPVQRVQRRLCDLMEVFSLSTGSGGVYDPDDAAVVRQCGCGHEWAEK